MFGELWKLLVYYCRRKDLQETFPEVKEGNLKRLLNWASYASQNLYNDRDAFEFLKNNPNFYYYARKYESFWPNPNEKSLPDLFYIFGAGRSGTTLLKRIMHCHSMTSSRDENVTHQGTIYPLLLKMERTFEVGKKWLALKAPALTDSLLADDYIVFPIPNQNDMIGEKFRNQYSNQPIVFLVRDVRDRISSNINLGKKTNVGLEGLVKLFEKWIKKNPYIQQNFADEISKIKNFKNKLFAYQALDWKIKNSALFVYKEKNLPVLDIKYEDLVSNTEATLRKITSFLEIPFEKTMLDFYKLPLPVTRALGIDGNFDDTRRNADKKSIGLYKKYLNSEIEQEVMEISSDMMKKLNY